MGHQNILVIGDNFRDQLHKFQRAEYAEPSNPYFVNVDVLEQAKREYESFHTTLLRASDGSLHKFYDEKFHVVLDNAIRVHRVPEGYTEIKVPVRERETFEHWARCYYGSRILAEGEEPDLSGKDRLGWARVNADGEICELIDRTIPGGFHDWFERTDDIFPLKPGARGLTNDSGDITVVTGGYAGLARKSAIDLDAMRKALRDIAAERWDRANAALGSQTWVPFKQFIERCNDEWAAKREWAAQPAVISVIEALANKRLDWDDRSRIELRAVHAVCNDHPGGIDPLALSRDEYLRRLGLDDIFCASVIMDGELLEDYDLDALIDGLPEDTVLTLVSVHS